MERPSHILFDSRHCAYRAPLVGVALSLQAVAVWLFMHSLVSGTLHFPPGPIVLTPFEEPKHPLPKPPEPKMKFVPIPMPPEPLSGVKFAPPENGPVAIAPPYEQGPVASMPVGVTRAPVSITATHTVPPYPPIERRIGVEGKVTLRLTVNAEGRVSEAEVVTSSGREGLDQAAQQWIMAHWTYKPALANGVAVASKALATVTFSLTNER
jgi:protein TonB